MIDFGSVALGFLTDNERYTVVFAGRSRSRFDRFGDALKVSDLRADVENGLVRFVRNNQIRQLAIIASNDKVLCLSKHATRSHLSVEVYDNGSW